MAGNIDFGKVDVERLGKDTPGIGSFKNRKASMVTYLQRDALADQEQKSGTTWVWVYDRRVVLGYVTLAMYSVDKKDIQNNRDSVAERFQHSAVPALLIGQLATHKEHEGKGIGMSMVSWAVSVAAGLSKKVGCRMVALHPHEDVVGWYRKLEFEIIRRERGQDIMYFDILSKNAIGR